MRIATSGDIAVHACRSRTTLQQAFIHAMMVDIETSLSKNLDAQLWKSCFHNVIERFREYDKQANENHNVKKLIEIVIEDVSENFELLGDAE